MKVFGEYAGKDRGHVFRRGGIGLEVRSLGGPRHCIGERFQMVAVNLQIRCGMVGGGEYERGFGDVDGFIRLRGDAL